MVEAQGCPGLMVIVWEVAHWAMPLMQKSLGLGPNKASVMGKGLVGEASGAK